MGNANSGLPYNEGGAIDYNHHWQLNEGTKKIIMAEGISIGRDSVPEGCLQSEQPSCSKQEAIFEPVSIL